VETLLQQAGEPAPDDLSTLTKAEASKRIDELQEPTGRGRRAHQAAPERHHLANR
jgi:hypothetical protein